MKDCQSGLHYPAQLQGSAHLHNLENSHRELQQPRYKNVPPSDKLWLIANNSKNFPRKNGRILPINRKRSFLIILVLWIFVTAICQRFYPKNNTLFTAFKYIVWICKPVHLDILIHFDSKTNQAIDFVCYWSDDDFAWKCK